MYSWNATYEVIGNKLATYPNGEVNDEVVEITMRKTDGDDEMPDDFATKLLRDDFEAGDYLIGSLHEVGFNPKRNKED